MAHTTTNNRLQNSGARTRGIRVVAIATATMIAVATATGSCFNTNTNTCEPSGRRCPDGLVCDIAQDSCIEPGGCGDGFMDQSKGEVCDDGDTQDGDGCSHDCRSKEICGNHITDNSKEQCDDGNLNDGDGCNSQCHVEACGNKAIDPGEVCDDGNTNSDDGCSANCMSNEVCGNGVMDDNGSNARIHEDCDPVATLPMQPKDRSDCDSDCTFAECGDGHLNQMNLVPDKLDNNKTHVEQCDEGDGSSKDTEGCNLDCTFAKCGDGYLNSVAHEECDDGNNNNDTMPDRCRTNCRRAHCGDLVKDQDEDCDTGGSNTATCNGNNNGANGPGSCKTPMCGDGYLNPASGAEQCDPGNNIKGIPEIPCANSNLICGSNCKCSQPPIN